MRVMGFGTVEPTDASKLHARREESRTMFATYRPVGVSCDDCALLDNGCFAQSGRVALHERRTHTQTFDPADYVAQLPAKAVLRINVSGDIGGPDGEAYRDGVRTGAINRPDITLYLYTHLWRRPEIIAWRDSLPSNITVAASCDTEADAMKAFLLGYETVTLVSRVERGWESHETVTAVMDYYRYLSDSHKGAPTLACPAQRKDKAKVGCADCMACTRPGLVIFASHGAAFRTVSNALVQLRKKAA